MRELLAGPRAAGKGGLVCGGFLCPLPNDSMGTVTRSTTPNFELRSFAGRGVVADNLGDPIDGSVFTLIVSAWSVTQGGGPIADVDFTRSNSFASARRPVVGRRRRSAEGVFLPTCFEKCLLTVLRSAVAINQRFSTDLLEFDLNPRQ